MPNQDPSIAQELLSHQAFLRRLALDLVGQDADDLVQEVWQRALERPPHHRGQLRGWLSRVARNLAANRWRGEARRSEREERRASERPAASELEARLELRKELVGALDCLHQACRETILLRYFEGLAPRDIAARQGAPLATVKTRLRRGLAQLREALDKRHGGDRHTWMSGLTALGMPLGTGVRAGTPVIGGIIVGTTVKVAAAALVAAVGLYFVTRAPLRESPPMATVVPMTSDAEFEDEADSTDSEGPTAASARTTATRSSVAQEAPESEASPLGANVLRVVLEGLTEEEARMATVTLMAFPERDGGPVAVGEAWPSQGLTSEFVLDPVLASPERLEALRAGELQVAVEHPHHLTRWTAIPRASRVDAATEKTVHEVRVALVRPDFWPEFRLDVRDALTRGHLENLELRIRPGPGAASWGRNTPSTAFADGLSSPIALMGGREPDQLVATVAGLALSPALGARPRLVELSHRFTPERGVIVSARAPGYAWGSAVIDVSQGERELLLEPATALDVRLANVQLERYAALETVPMLCVYLIREDGGNQYLHFEPLDESLEAEGLKLESIAPGGYRVAVELGGGSWTEQPVLAFEEVSLAAGETRALVLQLDDPPAPPARATLGGMVSFPAPTPTWGEEHVRLQLYFQPTQRWRDPDFEFSLANLQRVGGALPTWAFRVEDLPVGRYRVQLMPLLKVWMIDLPAGGAEGLELVLPELAEVLVETVDGRTGETVPRDELWYRHLEPALGQLQSDLARADTEEPGRFQFWCAPGAVRIWPKWPNGAEREFGGNGMDLQLVPGFQPVKFEFEPIYAMRLEFRVDGSALPTGPQGLQTTRDIRAVEHEGRVTDGGLQRDMVVEVSAPGLYEIHFDALDAELYHPIPPRLVGVRAGETTQVIVELHRK